MKKRAVLVLVFSLIFSVQFGQVIADHTVVSKFDDIPAYYINEVKKMYVAFYGESHSGAYDSGMELLEALNSNYACNVGSWQSYTDQYLRVEDVGAGIGEDLWFTWYSYSIPRPSDWKMTWLKDRITEFVSRGCPVNAIGFAWCADLTSSDNGHSPNVDPVYGVHWYGRSAGGIDGNKYWGLDGDDYSLTGNRVSLATYFGAMEEMISYCATASPTTRMVFTTGPVDVLYGEFSGEAGYQGHLKHEAIRSYVRASSSRVLFDYADILCYDDNGTEATQTWNGHTYPIITTKNFTPTVDAYHISEAGAIRLAKAQWWLLARLAGWDGVTASVNAPEDRVKKEISVERMAEEIRFSLDDSFIPSVIGLYDITGRLMSRNDVNSNIFSINTSVFNHGIYFVVITTPKGQRTEKIVI
jgi:hypothetical protein